MSAAGAAAGAPPAATRQTLEAILDQVRRLFGPSGCAFLIVEGEPLRIGPAAKWFSSPDVARAMDPILSRAYEPQRPGLTEAAIEHGAPLVLRSVDEWSGARALRERLHERLDADAAEIAWQWYRRSSFVACPVRTTAGRILGVLAIAVGPERTIGQDELRSVDALAGLAGLAIERSELLDLQAARAREELLLKEAAREMPASLEIDDVHRAIVDHARRLSGAPGIVLETVEPAGDAVRVVAAAGVADLAVGTSIELDRGARERALESGRVERDGDCVHVPIVLGPRRFGLLTIHPGADGPIQPDDVRRLEALAPLAAGALANALDFAQERRVARALARGFVPLSPPELRGLELGLVYDPAELVGGGGDFFGVWQLRDGSIAVLVGDVSGKGLEVSATSAMTRFFVEARAWDVQAPAEILRQVNELLCGRGRGLGFATAFLAILTGERLCYANAGHVPPLLRRRDGTVEELPASGVPLAIERAARWRQGEATLAPGEVLFAASDGLTEARRNGVILGEKRVRELVAEEGARLSPQELVDRAQRLAVEWAGRVRDDIVIVALRTRTVS